METIIIATKFDKYRLNIEKSHLLVKPIINDIILKIVINFKLEVLEFSTFLILIIFIILTKLFCSARPISSAEIPINCGKIKIDINIIDALIK